MISGRRSAGWKPGSIVLSGTVSDRKMDLSLIGPSYGHHSSIDPAKIRPFEAARRYFGGLFLDDKVVSAAFGTGQPATTQLRRPPGIQRKGSTRIVSTSYRFAEPPRTERAEHSLRVQLWFDGAIR